MTGKEIMKMLSQGKIPPRIPFVPTVYEHAAAIMGVTPSKMAKDVDLIVEGQLKAYELYGHDLVSVGVDIYNVEAEALGIPITYYDDETLPSAEGVLIKDKADLENLSIPDPEKDGRMPVYIEACRRINEAIGDKVPVSGTVVGPFTLAAILRGFENFLMDMMFDREFALEQLKFAEKVSVTYAQGFIKNGIGIAINESWIAPPLLSPELFKSIVFEFECSIIKKLKLSGLESVALVSGGNTIDIAEYLVKTGSSLLMADYNSDQRKYKRLCEQYGINLRASIDSKVVERGDTEEMEKVVQEVIEKCASNGRFILGCGVVSYNTSWQNVVQLKNIVERLNPYK